MKCKSHEHVHRWSKWQCSCVKFNLSCDFRTNFFVTMFDDIDYILWLIKFLLLLGWKIIKQLWCMHRDVYHALGLIDRFKLRSISFLGPLTQHQRPADEKKIHPVYSFKSNLTVTKKEERKRKGEKNLDSQRMREKKYFFIVLSVEKTTR